MRQRIIFVLIHSQLKLLNALKTENTSKNIRWHAGYVSTRQNNIQCFVETQVQNQRDSMLTNNSKQQKKYSKKQCDFQNYTSCSFKVLLSFLPISQEPDRPFLLQVSVQECGILLGPQQDLPLLPDGPRPRWTPLTGLPGG